MIKLGVARLTTIAMLAFAGNSLLCRMALRGAHIDPVSFTIVRLASGSITLWLLVRVRGGSARRNGSWLSASALFAYAIAFSYAYVTLPASAGALLLFGAVQATMIGYGLWRGERFDLVQWGGLVLASAGLVGLMLPGFAAPPIVGSLLMIVAGVAWGVYSLRGRAVGDATASTAGNFLRALALGVPWSIVLWSRAEADAGGVAYAVASGALASGLGYVVWYAALPSLRATSAAAVQLSVPVIAAIGAVVLIGEPITYRLVLASLAVLGGIALVIFGRDIARQIRPADRRS